MAIRAQPAKGKPSSGQGEFEAASALGDNRPGSPVARSRCYAPLAGDKWLSELSVYGPEELGRSVVSCFRGRPTLCARSFGAAGRGPRARARASDRGCFFLSNFRYTTLSS